MAFLEKARELASGRSLGTLSAQPEMADPTVLAPRKSSTASQFSFSQ